MPKECPAQIHAASRNPCRERVPRDRDLITQNRTDKTQAVRKDGLLSCAYAAKRRRYNTVNLSLQFDNFVTYRLRIRIRILT